MPCKRRVFSSHTKASSHSKKKVNKFTHVSVQAHISSYTANIMNSIQHCHMAHQIQILQRVAVVEPSHILQAEQSIQSSCQTAYELAYSMLITCISGCLASWLTLCRPKHSDIAARQWCGGQRDTKCLVVGDSDLWQLQMLMEGSHLLIPSKPRCATSSQDLFQTQVQESSTKVSYASLIL